MHSSPINTTAGLLQRVDQTLALPLADYHKLKLVLRDTLTALNADRCWLMFPCVANAEQYLVPIEETTADYPGANRLKLYTPANPLFADVARNILTSKEPVSFDFNNMPPQVRDIYSEHHTQSQLACQITTDNSDCWGFGVQHCAQHRDYSEGDKELLSAVAKRIKSTLGNLLDIPNLINAAGLSSEILDNSPLAQVIYNLDHELVYANAAYCKMNQRSLKELIGQHRKQGLGKREQYLFNQFLDTIQANGQAFAHSEKVTGTNKTIHVENNGSSILYGGEKHSLIASRDVTEEKETKLALIDSLAVQHATFEAIDDGVLVEDIDRNVIAINQNFYRFFNTSRPTTDSIHTLDLLKAGIPAIQNIDKIAPLVVGLLPTSMERNLSTIYLISGLVLEMNSFPLIHKNEVKGRVWYYKDVTERLKTQAALENSLVMLRAISQASDDGLLVEDLNRNVISANPVFVETFKLSQQALEQEHTASLDLFALTMPLISNAEEIACIVSEASPSSEDKINVLLHLHDGDVLDIKSFPLIHDESIQGRVWFFKNVTHITRSTKP
ncbi:MAG TPA: PAS domain S-box protein [Cycloclasticus sp.]|jgi:PAS domain S-box-containing protein|nr:PAS domain S-box protein [Cycloclasticus sp.]